MGGVAGGGVLDGDAGMELWQSVTRRKARNVPVRLGGELGSLTPAGALVMPLQDLLGPESKIHHTSCSWAGAAHVYWNPTEKSRHRAAIKIVHS